MHKDEEAFMEDKFIVDAICETHDETQKWLDEHKEDDINYIVFKSILVF